MRVTCPPASATRPIFSLAGVWQAFSTDRQVEENSPAKRQSSNAHNCLLSTAGSSHYEGLGVWKKKTPPTHPSLKPQGQDFTHGAFDLDHDSFVRLSTHLQMKRWRPCKLRWRVNKGSINTAQNDTGLSKLAWNAYIINNGAVVTAMSYWNFYEVNIYSPADEFSSRPKG